MLCALWLLAGGDPSPVTIQPIATNLPGSAVLGGLADGLDFWALLAAVVGLIVGAVMWAFGRRTTPMKFLVSSSQEVEVWALDRIRIGRPLVRNGTGCDPTCAGAAIFYVLQ